MTDWSDVSIKIALLFLNLVIVGGGGYFLRKLNNVMMRQECERIHCEHAARHEQIENELTDLSETVRIQAATILEHAAGIARLQGYQNANKEKKP